MELHYSHSGYTQYYYLHFQGNVIRLERKTGNYFNQGFGNGKLIFSTSKDTTQETLDAIEAFKLHMGILQEDVIEESPKEQFKTEIHKTEYGACLVMGWAS